MFLIILLWCSIPTCKSSLPFGISNLVTSSSNAETPALLLLTIGISVHYIYLLFLPLLLSYPPCLPLPRYWSLISLSLSLSQSWSRLVSRSIRLIGSRSRICSRSRSSGSAGLFLAMILPLPMRRPGMTRGWGGGSWISRSGRCVVEGMLLVLTTPPAETWQPCPKLRRWGLNTMPSFSSLIRSFASAGRTKV